MCVCSVLQMRTTWMFTWRSMRCHWPWIWGVTTVHLVITFLVSVENEIVLMAWRKHLLQEGAQKFLFVAHEISHVNWNLINFSTEHATFSFKWILDQVIFAMDIRCLSNKLFTYLLCAYMTQSTFDVSVIWWNPLISNHSTLCCDWYMVTFYRSDPNSHQVFEKLWRDWAVPGVE